MADTTAARVSTSTVALGLATGGRSSLGVAIPVLATWSERGAVRRVTTVASVAGELVADKLPTTPSRLQPGPLVGRLLAGATGGVMLARHRGAGLSGAAVAALLGGAGAAAGAYAGAAWRSWAGQRVPDPVAAVAEDAVVLGLAVWVTRRAS